MKKFVRPFSVVFFLLDMMAVLYVALLFFIAQQ